MNKDCQNRRIVDADAIVKLKKKAIKDFNKFLYTLFKGYKGNYKQLLNVVFSLFYSTWVFKVVKLRMPILDLLF